LRKETLVARQILDADIGQYKCDKCSRQVRPQSVKHSILPLLELDTQLSCPFSAISVNKLLLNMSGK
jgi:hypothetical protein